MVLTVELNDDKDKVEIFFDKEGLMVLKHALEKIDLKNLGTDHINLRTKEWGGNELTSEVMHEGSTSINDLKLIYINTR